MTTNNRVETNILSTPDIRSGSYGSRLGYSPSQSMPLGAPPPPSPCAIAEPDTIPPISPCVGTLWTNTVTGVTYYYTGSIWVSVYRLSLYMSRDLPSTNIHLNYEDSPSNLSPFLAPYKLIIKTITITSVSLGNWVCNLKINASTIASFNVISGKYVNISTSYLVNPLDLISIYVSGTAVTHPKLHIEYSQVY